MATIYIWVCMQWNMCECVCVFESACKCVHLLIQISFYTNTTLRHKHMGIIHLKANNFWT